MLALARRAKLFRFDKGEFFKCMHLMELGLSDLQIEAMFKKMDTDGSGELDWQEFAQYAPDLIKEMTSEQASGSRALAGA